MAAVMWIEVVSRDGHVYARERIAAEEARIGRAFDNDVVVDDPHVAPHHLRIFRGEDGELVAEDLGTVNGLYAEHGEERMPRMSLAREPGLRIGRTVLRIHDSAHAVAAEKALAPPRAHVRWAAILATVLLALTLLLSWLEITADASASRLMLPLLAVAVAVVAWSAMWALLSRIFSGQAHFAAMARIALTGALAITLWQQLAEWLSFALAWRDVSDFQSLGGWALLVATCYAHLRAIGPRHMGAAMGLVVALVATGAGLQYIGKSETRKSFGQRATLGELKPPALRIVPLATTDDFFKDAAQVKQRVDAARTHEPAGAGLMDFD
jgi:cation transport ATPase